MHGLFFFLFISRDSLSQPESSLLLRRWHTVTCWPRVTERRPLLYDVIRRAARVSRDGALWPENLTIRPLPDCSSGRPKAPRLLFLGTEVPAFSFSGRIIPVSPAVHQGSVQCFDSSVVTAPRAVGQVRVAEREPPPALVFYTCTAPMTQLIRCVCRAIVTLDFRQQTEPQ